MSRSNHPHQPTASEQLEALLGHPWPFTGRPPRHDLSTWIVTDDWPADVPVTEAEMDVFERWFGDLFDDHGLLKARNPKVMPSRVVSGPTMLIGLIHCAKCGGAMTIRTGKGGRYRYYACST